MRRRRSVTRAISASMRARSTHAVVKTAEPEMLVVRTVGIEPVRVIEGAARKCGRLRFKLARQPVLGQGRPVVGLVGLVAGEGQRAVVTALAQRLGPRSPASEAPPTTRPGLCTSRTGRPPRTDRQARPRSPGPGPGSGEPEFGAAAHVQARSRPASSASRAQR